MRERHHRAAGFAPRPEKLAARLWPYVLLVGIAAAFCGPAVFTGRALAPLDMLLLMSPWKHYAHQFPAFSRVQNPMLDPVQQYFPWRLFAVSSLKQGVLPLWNPYAFCGTPFVANLQSAIFYPPNLLFLIMPVALGFTYSAVLHLALAGCFMFSFLRVWGISRWPALTAAAAYMLNGYFIAWLEYPAIGLWVAVWLPLLLALYELSLRRRSWSLGALAGLVIGVQLLGGHLQVAAYSILAFGLYALARTLSPALEGSDALRRWEPPLRAAVTLALGLLLAAGQLLPTLELSARSHRPPIPPAAIRNTALPFSHLVIYLVPKFFGSPADYNYWGNLVGRPDINFLETSGYVGVMTLLLACCGALEWRRPLAKFLLALGGVSLLLALGTPLYLVLYYVVPGFKQLAGVARIMSLTAFALVALAGLGLERLLRDTGARAARTAGVFSLAAVGFVAADLWLFRPQIVEPHRAGVEPIASFPRYLAAQVLTFAGLLAVAWVILLLRARLRPTFRGVACLALVCADLFITWGGFNPVTDPRMAYFETASTRYLRRHADGSRMLAVGTSFLDWMPPNTPMAYSLRDIQGSDSLWWERYARFIAAAQPGAPTFDWRNLGTPVLDMLGVRFLAATRPVAHPAWELVSDRDALVYRRRAPTSRARLVSDWEAASAAQALQTVASGDRALLERPILDRSPGIARTPGAAPGVAAIAADDTNRVSVHCRAPGPRVLMLGDPNYPGWRARVDGKAVRHLTANYVLRAVAVPAGEHVVTWRYEPTAFRLGLFGGLIGGAAVLAVISAGLARRAAPR